jgi:mono/diheme cytochrome c family protein
LVIAWIRSMDPVAHGLPVDGGTAGSEIFGDWSEVVSDPFGDPPAETETPVTDGPTDTVDLTNLTAPTPVGSPAAMAALVERGALANRISADSPMVDVVFGLLRESAGDDDLALLAGLETVLSSLDLSGTAVTDGGLLALTGFKQIERLHLENTAVGDAGLAHLSDLKALTYLNLYGTAVTDAGLQQLAELGSLRKLFLWQTAVTDAGAEELQLQLPELAIIRGVDVLELPPALVIVEGATTFAEHVGPIFSAKCTSCHGAEEPAAGLRFDTFDAVFEKTWAEWAVKPGDTESSRLIAALRLEPGTKGAMPKKGDPLTAEELGLVVAWVEGLHEEEVDTLEVDTEEGQDEDL